MTFRLSDGIVPLRGAPSTGALSPAAGSPTEGAEDHPDSTRHVSPCRRATRLALGLLGAGAVLVTAAGCGPGRGVASLTVAAPPAHQAPAAGSPPAPAPTTVPTPAAPPSTAPPVSAATAPPVTAAVPSPRPATVTVPPAAAPTTTAAPTPPAAAAPTTTAKPAPDACARLFASWGGVPLLSMDVKFGQAPFDNAATIAQACTSEEDIIEAVIPFSTSTSAGIQDGQRAYVAACAVKPGAALCAG